MPHILTLPGTRDAGDTYSAEQDIDGGALTIPAGQKAYGSTANLFWLGYSHASVINDGTIWNLSQSNVVGAIGGYYIGFITNRGLIVAEATNGNSTAVFAGSGLPSMANYGQIFAIAHGNATGVENWDPSAYLYNEGTIAAYAPAAGQDGVGAALGVALNNGGHVENAAGGAILAEGVNATALIFSRGALNDNGGPQISNAGRIEAYSLDANQPSIAILTAPLEQESMRVVNSGLIRADIAYRDDSEYYSPPQRSADQIFNLAGGEIDGLFDTRLGDDLVVNSGTINGNFLTGEGADTVDTKAGVWNGIADLGWGDDTFFGSAADDKVMGGRDADWLEGNGGQDLLFGGVGNDVLIGGAGNDGLYAEYGDDLIVTQGGDIALGGDGNDIIRAGDLTFSRIDGGTGQDRLVLTMGPVALDLALVRASGRLADIEAIELRGNQRLIVHAEDIQPLTGGEKQLDLYTTASDGVELIGAWHEGPPTAHDGLLFRQFVLGDETVMVNGNGLVSIAAAPSAAGVGLDPVAGGPAAPAVDSRADVGATSATIILNNYQLHGNETVTAAETWRTQQGQEVVDCFVADYSLTNFGRIESVATGANSRAAAPTNIHDVTNHGVIIATSSGLYEADAVLVQDFGAVFNDGTIEADAADGRALGAQAQQLFGQNGINFINAGVIQATDNGASRAIGANVVNGVSGINSGTISATGGDTTTGLALFGEQAFLNDGTVVAARVQGISGSSVGIAIGAGINDALLRNLGLIQGDKAIVDQSFQPNGFLTIDNHGRIQGAIELGDRMDAIENFGSVAGDVHLGGGNDLWLGAGGTLNGAVFGGDGNDLIIGSAAADLLNGDAGDDLIVGGLGADQLAGGAGADIFVYTSAADSNAASFDTITGFESGIDRIDLSGLGASSITLGAGAGYTLLSAVTAAGTLAVHVTGSIAMSDIVTGPPTQAGGGGADLLYAGAGGASLAGNGGDDLLVGGSGNDRLDGGFGINALAGGLGDDVYVVSSAATRIWELDGQGHDRIELNLPGSPYQMPDGVEDILLTSAGYATGNALSNQMIGSSGDDGLNGGDGGDILNGGDGSDRLEGDAGADRMTGGAGDDIFVMLQISDSRDSVARSDGHKVGGVDIITDFTSGHDRISLADIDAVPDDGNDHSHFTFIGAGAFSNHEGELRYEVVDGNANIYADLNGDGIADLHILVQNVTTLAAGDFVL